ncbi:hypothetical protein [Paraburkholderia bannensis]|uniref:hypothetical protein n=1 Tax=Paraburkholderia bannensis TaxID=765414 RepID=UPI002AB7787F|nr:hypothetical protein [Paraburkholderia bannensis]
MTFTWGLLGPGALPGERRTRTLGVAASVRQYNELAVPGLGGIWFGKQVLLATLGVKVAELASPRGGGVTNIETANAIEALACWLDLESRQWQADPRLRGVNKMKGQTDLAFKRLREPRFYVTQPMRMATVEALPALGLVAASGTRFNAFECTDAGELFVTAACEDWRPSNRTVVDHLAKWASSSENVSMKTYALKMALSPTRALPARARALLLERLVSGSGSEPADARQCRRDALAWVETVRSEGRVYPTWEARPAQISAPHWHDLHTGARFVAVRDAALDVLDTLEAIMANASTGARHALSAPVPPAVAQKLAVLRQMAQEFLAAQPRDRIAHAFACECNGGDDVGVLRALVARDTRVLRLRGNEVVPGPAFQAHGAAAGATDLDDPGADAAPPTTQATWPENVSFRVRNLFLLNADLQGDLDRWLATAPPTAPVTDSLIEEAA